MAATTCLDLLNTSAGTCATLGTSWWEPAAMGPTAGICASLLESSLGTSWWVEPLIATASFALWMNLFRTAEVGVGVPWRSRVLAWPPNDFTVSIFSSLVAYWVGVGGWTRLVPPPAGIESGCPSDAASLLQLLAETWCGVVGYDFLFYWIHLSMHTWPRLGRLVGHSTHHDHDGHDGASSGSESAMRTLHHSLLDGVMQVLVSITVQRRTPWGSAKTRLARWLHNFVVSGLLTESHSTGPLRLARRLAVFGGVRDHHLHHRHRSPPYQQFFTYLDSTVSLRVASGEMLRHREEQTRDKGGESSYRAAAGG